MAQDRVESSAESAAACFPIKDWSEFYNSVYTARDSSDKQPHGWIQWKGTNVCIDLHCECGHHGHVDGDFFYQYRCPECHQKYAVGQVVKLIKLTQEEIEYLEREGHGDFDSDTD